ncbi:ROK family transcriptional regulator [Microbacterium terrisoli]|uniref:ROK family transcriptional regulator n=1 Tax=Microbacterium terrisoli TaxID=3242192 RepID=UPI00351D0A24
MSASGARRGPSTESAAAEKSAVMTPVRHRRHAAKVLPEHARAHNRSLVLQTLFHRGAMSRADLSRATGLTRVTISDLISELIADGFVAEKGVREVSRPGKPAILVDLDHAGHRIVSLDLSGTSSFTGGILTLDGQIVVRREIPHPGADGDVIGAIIAFAAELVADSHAPVLGVGVGTPGIVDDAGVVLTAPNLGLTGFDLEGALRDELKLPVVVANDANAAVLAEYTFGDAGDDVILVKVGRGVGSGLLSDGRPMIGSRFAAGEIGHVTVATDGGPLCSCGKIGCLEAWISAPSLHARLAEAHDDDARAGVLRDAGERLGIALAPVVGALDLSEVVLSGPEDLLDGPLAAATAETLRTRTLAKVHEGIRVRMTEQGPDIVLRGAAVMVLSGQLGVS